MDATKSIIEPLLPKKLEVIIQGETDNIIVIDWDQIVKGENDDYEDILGYFVENKSCQKKIDKLEWKPFGLLGLCHNPDSFAETSNHGLLLFDLTNKDKNNPPVILWKDEKSKTIAQHFSELKITEVK
jgi:hypothetical protein